MQQLPPTSAGFNEKLFLHTFQLAGTSVIINACKLYTIVAASNSFAKTFGFEPTDLEGKYFFDIFLDNNNGAITILKSNFNMVVAEKSRSQVAAYPVNSLMGASTVSYWSATNVPLLDENGEVAYIIHTPVNITDQINLKHEQAARMLNLQIQQERMNELFMKAPVGVTFLNSNNFIIEYANSAICEMWNRYLSEDVVGKPVFDVVLEAAELRIILEKVVRTGNHFTATDAPVLLGRNGEIKTCYFDLIFEPLRDGENVVSGIICIAVDVTEKVEARLKLEDAEQRLRLATEATGLGTWDLDLRTERIIYSPWIAEIFGFSVEQELTHRQMFDCIHPDDIAMVRKAFETAIQSGRYFYEARIVWSDGTIRWIRTIGKVIYNNRHEPVRMLGTINDVTAQRSIINELKASEENLRLATEAAELGTFDLDLIKGTMDWDKRCRELFGIYTPRPVNYQHDFLTGLHPDDRERVAAVIANCMNKSVNNGDYDVEYRTIGVEDEKLRWIRAKGKVFFDEGDRPVRFMGAVIDITENKLDEIRKNDFIAMASHELKTPLTSLKAYIQLLLMKARKTDNEFLISSLKKSENQVNKMTSLIYGFLDLSKIEAGKLKLNLSEFDMNTVIEEVIAESEPIAPGYTIQFERTTVLNIKADAEKISQVLVNFISNAVKYSPKHSTIKVVAMQKDGFVKVAVHDEGIGIDSESQRHIFERFYRVDHPETKGFSGFGIGLYLSAEIIKLHKGVIGVESKENEGSAFYFELPVNF
ncbi:PAS domain-containing sensor histidine kinase [Mucilaginibacter auburnensis]|uniref:histidine kinase n=1 Tax=Mucilaginibacter auburnensis TaxID=1457233 RepID=A0A2H9VUU3_9SPHI|nr:PAS domain-containing protein [Mucilaginibacter auburnensis]PJJ84594.1 PAS domain S-box-containing protein [Mucilaginibacter auburnensis]